MNNGQPNELIVPGGRVGARIAKLAADGVAYTRLKTGDHMGKIGVKIFTDTTNHVSDEIRSVMGPIFREAAEHPETPDEARPLLRALGNERGQAWAWIAGTATGAAMGGGLMNLLTNYLNPAVLPMIAAQPNGILSPTDAAMLSARSLDNLLDTDREAAYSGINGRRFNALVELNRTRVPLSEVWEMLNRGTMSLNEATRELVRTGYPVDTINDLMNLRRQEFSGPELAAMWNRGILNTQQTRDLGNRVGYSDAQMDQLMTLGGEPPAPQELLLAWRRGHIDEGDVDRALIQGPLRREWIPVIKQLQWAPLPLGEAADAVNQGHLSLSEARRSARENGVRDKDFDTIIANAGLPPGPQEVLDWLNRGIINRTEALQALYESRIKNKWVPTYLESRHETMPPETVRLMYSRGAIGRTDALHRLQIRGYSAEDAAIILEGASAEKTAATRDLTQTQIRELYSERAISRNDALGMLTDSGFEVEEAVLILELGDFQRLRRFVNAATNRIKAGFITGRLDENQAIGFLDSLGLAADQRDEMITLWQIEQATVTKGLTASQVQQAYRRGYLTAEQAGARLIGQGYDPEDASILLNLALPASEAGT